MQTRWLHLNAPWHSVLYSLPDFRVEPAAEGFARLVVAVYSAPDLMKYLDELARRMSGRSQATRILQGMGRKVRAFAPYQQLSESHHYLDNLRATTLSGLPRGLQDSPLALALAIGKSGYKVLLPLKDEIRF